MSEQGNSIKPFDPIQVATEQDDIIVLPLDYRLNEKSLDAGDGDDILITTGGNVTLTAGKGNNIISLIILMAILKLLTVEAKIPLFCRIKRSLIIRLLITTAIDHIYLRIVYLAY